MPAENTELERRVLAHEQILQALMAQLADSEPGFLDRMLERFATARRGSYEHDYVETADYAEAFLHEVIRLGRSPTSRAAHGPMVAPILAPPSVEPAREATVIRTASTRGVWHVTRDDVFLGDYLAEAPARAAATKASREIEDAGGRAELIFGEAP
jgi:hypothetical protein